MAQRLLNRFFSNLIFERKFKLAFCKFPRCEGQGQAAPAGCREALLPLDEASAPEAGTEDRRPTPFPGQRAAYIPLPRSSERSGHQRHKRYRCPRQVESTCLLDHGLRTTLWGRSKQMLRNTCYRQMAMVGGGPSFPPRSTSVGYLSKVQKRSGSASRWRS